MECVLEKGQQSDVFTNYVLKLGEIKAVVGIRVVLEGVVNKLVHQLRDIGSLHRIGFVVDIEGFKFC